MKKLLANRSSFLILLLCFLPFLLSGCHKNKVTEPPQNGVSSFPQGDEDTSKRKSISEEVQETMSAMTLQEKVSQMFVVSTENLTGADSDTSLSEVMKEKLMEYPAGGMVFFAENLVNEEQTKKMLADLDRFAKDNCKAPLFLCVDEEGGRVARIGNNPGFSVKKVGAMGKITSEKKAKQAGLTIGEYLSELGFTVDFAPDADVLSNHENAVIGDRSFGKDAEKVTTYSAAYSDGLHEFGIFSTFKHFPGHGATEGDTHDGFAFTNKSLDELLSCELLPFSAAESKGVDFVMAAHIAVPNVIEDNTPSSLSEKMITEVLRERLGYQGIIITDAMDMGAITSLYSSEEASLLAIKAGVDMVLMPEDYFESVHAVVRAVENGDISEERINESIRRILTAKKGSQESGGE